ncbi:hypothetical protein M9458_019496, partial [Cirrhinus mrigala]
VALYHHPCGVAATHPKPARVSPPLTLTSPTPLPSTLQTLAFGAATASRRPACPLLLLLLTLGTTALEPRVERDTLMYMKCTLICTPVTHIRIPTHT